MADITEEQLKKEIAKILENADLAKTSTKKVIIQLEKNLGAELKDKKAIIDQLVMDYVNSKESGDEEASDAESEDASEKSDEAPKKKKPAKRAAAKPDPVSDEESDEEETKKKKPKRQKAQYQSKQKSQSAWRSSEEDSEEEKKPKKKGKKRSGGDSDDDWSKKKEKSSGPRKGSGYTRAYKLSPELSELMGAEMMPRHEVVKRVWEIIKKQDLYDPNNKQFAICNDQLYKVIGTKRFRTFGMMKYLKTHFLDD